MVVGGFLPPCWVVGIHTARSLVDKGGCDRRGLLGTKNSGVARAHQLHLTRILDSRFLRQANNNVGGDMSSIKGVPAMDVLPEHFPYHDKGCNVSPSCLHCPLRQCRHDDPGWLRREGRAQRDTQVLHARRREGATILELARRYSISERTVHRILARAQNGGKRPRTTEWGPFPRQHARQQP